MGFGNVIDSIPEGTHLSIRYPDYDSRIKSGTSGSYWMRSPEPSWSFNVKFINVDSSNSNDQAFNGTIGIVSIIVIH